MKTVCREIFNASNQVLTIVELSFTPFEYTTDNIQNVMNLIRGRLSRDLLIPGVDYNPHNPLYGHCYCSSQALICLMNTDKLVQVGAEKHMWVQDKNKIYDVTADQYYNLGLLPPYEKGVIIPLEKYHRNTFTLIERILGDGVEKRFRN